MNLESGMQQITKENLSGIMPQLLSLEHNWVGIGDTAWVQENFEKDLPGKWELSKCILVDGKLAGYLIGSVDGKIGRLNKILVDTSIRGKGLGDKLWSEFLNDCRKKGLERAEFKVLIDNEVAMNFYKRRGCLLGSAGVVGSDGKSRYPVSYAFKLNKRILHSKPTLGFDDLSYVTEAIHRGDLATGNFVREFVSAMSSYTGRSYGVATSSGTAALHLALRSLDVGEGDEVLIPSYACNSILNVVAYCGATPILVDINKDDYNMSYHDCKSKVSHKTKAVILPHMFGKPVKDIESFLKLNIPIIEDCALSIGASHNNRKVGSFGTISVFSFYATKMMASGVGGMILTDDDVISKNLTALTSYDNRVMLGESYNYKMSDLQAALGLSQLKKLDGFVERRKELADKYNDMFKSANIDFALPSYDNENIFFRYIINHSNLDSFMKHVKARGVDVARPIFMPLHSYLGLPDERFPNTSSAYKSSVSIPIYPSLTDVDIENIASILINWDHEKTSGGDVS